MNFELNLNESQDFVLESRDAVGFEVGGAESSSFEISSITVAVPNKGDKGDTGENGERGERGEQGIRGEKGETGERGPVGPQGPVGPVGPVGPRGERGLTGLTGPQGLIGPAGPRGPQGIQGVKGDRGDIGPAGPRGEVGPQGPIGPRGERGEPGSVDNVDYSNLLNKPDLTIYCIKTETDRRYAPIAHTHPWTHINGRPSVMSATEANAGTANYDRLIRASILKGAIQAHQIQPDWNATSGKGVILNRPDLLLIRRGNAVKDTTNNIYAQF